jgi:hypothetical protein
VEFRKPDPHAIIGAQPHDVPVSVIPVVRKTPRRPAPAAGEHRTGGVPVSQPPGAADRHVFVSYAHDDGLYTERLVDHLLKRRIAVFWDRNIPPGHRWAPLLRDRIDQCSALVVVMTPAAEESRGVEREINRAEHAGRPIIPLLLAGKPFFLLADLQFHDVTGGAMPSPHLVERLRRANSGGSLELRR